MQLKYFIFIPLMLFSAKGYCQDDDTPSKKLIDSLEDKMYVDHSLNYDSALKYSRECLVINKKLAEADFLDFFQVPAFFQKKEFDSAYIYGKIFLKRKYKKDDGVYWGYGKGRDSQLETSEMLYEIDTTRHNYKEAVKLLLTHNPETWWFGSATNFHRRMRYYYTKIMNCYIAMGKTAEADKYKKKAEQE